MENIIDYVKQNMNRFSDTPLNDVDSLVLSEFSYIKLKKVFDAIDDPVTIKDLYKAELFEDMFKEVVTTEKNKELLSALACSRRFRDIQILSYVEETSEFMQKQFCAITFLLKNDLIYIAFRGTDASLVGWKEDFNMAFMCPVPSQSEALSYVERVASKWKGDIIVGGHSKGGNLAMYSVMMANENVQNRVLAVYSHDGPGFNCDNMLDEGYERIKSKIKKTIPQSSLVGMLLGNNEQYRVVKSSTVGIMQHDPFTWIVDNYDFIYQDKLNGPAQFVNKTINNWIMDMTVDEREQFVEFIFLVLRAGDANTLGELSDNWQSELHAMLSAYKNIDDDRRKDIMQFIRHLIKMAIKSV